MNSIIGWLKKYLIAAFFLAAPSCHVFGQVYAFAGIHKSDVRNEVLINDSPIYSWHVGGGVNLYPNRNWCKASINLEVAFFQKGYDQNLGTQQFEFRFRYLTWQAALSYPIAEFLSIKGGVNLALLLDTNVKKGMSTYQLFDCGLMGGVEFLENKRIGFYTRVVYGLVPMLKYYDIDAMGNFNGRINDLKNTCFMLGLRVKIYDKKISLKK